MWNIKKCSKRLLNIIFKDWNDLQKYRLYNKLLFYSLKKESFLGISFVHILDLQIIALNMIPLISYKL